MENLYYESQFMTTSRNNMQITPWENVGKKLPSPEDWNFFERRYRQEHRRKHKKEKLMKMKTIIGQRKQLMSDMIQERIKHD